MSELCSLCLYPNIITDVCICQVNFVSYYVIFFRIQTYFCLFFNIYSFAFLDFQCFCLIFFDFKHKYLEYPCIFICLIL